MRAELNYPGDFLHISFQFTIEMWMFFQISYYSTARIGSLSEKSELAWNFTNNGIQAEIYQMLAFSS